MKTYSLKSIFRFALNTEEKGNVFYQDVARYTQDKDIKKLFNYLSKQEIKHAKTFLKLYHSCADKKNIFLANPELSEVLDAIFRGLIFPDISEVRDSTVKKDALVRILKIAMDVEINTIIFYDRMKECIKSYKIKEILSKIITEEEKHLVKLKKMRINLDPTYAKIIYGKFF
ncbi:MAG: ferritin family protein [Omnitrophica bacterium]|nr:ferritin family protein [Candidatus Omnitrophota bacterium]